MFCPKSNMLAAVTKPLKGSVFRMHNTLLNLRHTSKIYDMHKSAWEKENYEECKKWERYRTREQRRINVQNMDGREGKDASEGPKIAIQD